VATSNRDTVADAAARGRILVSSGAIRVARHRNSKQGTAFQLSLLMLDFVEEETFFLHPCRKKMSPVFQSLAGVDTDRQLGRAGGSTKSQR
jgi:hypothetical protein